MQRMGLFTKEYYRNTVWNHMEDNNIASFPRPVYHRIPNFFGSDEAGNQLLRIPEFRSARIVKVNPDRPQTQCRYLVLKRGKRLFVPPAGLKRNAVLTEIKLPHHLKDNEQALRYAATRKGFEEYGHLLTLQAMVRWDPATKIDVVVIGSVAIDHESGYRIGKGEGFADMEIAVMNEFGLIDQNTTFIVTMHDCQLFKGIDDRLFDPGTDTRLDYICTPTQIIKIKRDRKRKSSPLPYHIDWDKLSAQRMRRIPFLRTLKEYRERKRRQTGRF